jgi:hemin uptake protein HemP
VGLERLKELALRMSLRYNGGVLGSKDHSLSESRATSPSKSMAPPSPTVLDSAALFGRSNELRLWHRGQEYRLRITKAGKLILTK